MHPNPMSLDQGAIATHEMFMAYVRAGFTEDQALRIILTYVRESIRLSQQPPES